MSSGFNHIKITVGEGFLLDNPYKITEQISEDIFNNDKQLYCHLILPPGSEHIIGVTKIVATMFKIGDTTYGNSIISVSGNSTAVISIGISKDASGEVYLIIYFKTI